MSRRHAVVCAVCSVVAVATSFGLGRLVAEHDVIAAAVDSQDFSVAVLVGALLLLRLFLVLAAPGWLLFALASGVLGLRRRARGA
jgi:hypothetical protein